MPIPVIAPSLESEVISLRESFNGSSLGPSDGAIAMMTPAYPRDMIGYGPMPPDPQWPGGARLALNFVLNY